jgi:hypothetical protein
MGYGHPVRTVREWDHRTRWAAEVGMRHNQLVAHSVVPNHKVVDLVRVQVHILDDGHRRESRDALGQIGKVGRLVVVRRLQIEEGK